MIEVWKNTPHPNYEVSILGKVRNKRTMRAGESGRKLSVEYNISEQRVCDIHKGRTSL